MNDSNVFVLSSIWLLSFDHWIGGLICLILSWVLSDDGQRFLDKLK